MNVAVTQLDLRRLNRCLVYFDCFLGTAHCGAGGFRIGFECVVVRTELFVLLAGDDALLN